MTGKHHNNTLQTNQEETQNTNSHKTAERQLQLSNQVFLPQQDDCKTRKDPWDTKHCRGVARVFIMLMPTKIKWRIKRYLT